jgi:hypothetical protein
VTQWRNAASRRPGRSHIGGHKGTGGLKAKATRRPFPELSNKRNLTWDGVGDSAAYGAGTVSPEEVRACFRLFAAFRMREIGPFERILATLTARRRRRTFMKAFAQIANLR